jgi:hypothetical protein
MRSLIVLGALLAIPFVIGTAVAPGDPDRDEVLRFADQRIVESSGLVAADGLFVTTNDSGDPGRLFVVDGSGRTVGLTRWADDPVDVEALAPAGSGLVWVGDIGDNPDERSSISVTRVPVGPGDRTVEEPAYRLVYPDGARDAEALLRHPTTGRLYVASKVAFGGTLYAAPAELDPARDNRLRRVGGVAGLVTDGAFFPDGRHLVLRTYTAALVYSFPALDVVGEIELPAQDQGEGIAVEGDTLYLSSEGVRSALLRLAVPEEVRTAMAAPTTPSPTAGRGDESPSNDGSRTPGANGPAAPAGGRDAWPWVLGGVAMILVVITLLRALRPR